MPDIAQPSCVSEDEMKTLKVGGKVDLYRRGLGLTVGGFATKCRVAEKTMERICLRESDPSAKTLFCLLRYGNMSLDILDLEDFGEEGLI